MPDGRVDNNDGVITFRALTEGDFDLLAGWLASEHVQQWWRDSSAPWTVQEKYGPRVRGEVPTEVFVVCSEGADIGIIQRYRIAEHPEWLETLNGTPVDASGAAGIDYLIGDAAVVGFGLGTEMIRAFTAKAFSDLDNITSIVVTPQVANTASCRALEKAGYDKQWIGVLDSTDPADDDAAAVYVYGRPSLPSTGQ